MITRKPRKTRSGASAKKGTSRKKEEINASLPVLSDENIYSDDFLKIRQTFESQEKIPRVVIPKIKIKCEPLNVERVIDLVNNEVVDESSLKKPREKKRKKSEPNKGKRTTNSKNPAEHVTEESSSPLQNKKPIKQAKKKLKVDSCSKGTGSIPKKCESDDYRKKTKIRIVLKNHKVGQSGQPNIVGNKPQQLEQSSSNMNNNNSNTNEVPPLFYSNMDDVSDIIKSNNISLEELAPFVEAITEADLKMKMAEAGNEKNKSIQDGMFSDSNVLLNCNDFAVTNEKPNVLDQRSQHLSNFKKTSLQVAVESFMNSPQLKYLRENNALKTGLCFSWLSNNYKCSDEKCVYSHNAVNLFTRKLKQYPSKFIITIVVSMRNDALFADVILAALKILSERKIPTVWVTFLIFFVFYVTEPSDKRFLKFWANAARFFCQLSEGYSAASGFASLLSIFVQGDKSEEWKIIEFIKLIKQPPVQVSTTFALLQPVLKLDIPSQFLAEAVESCMATQKDVLNVYSMIIPKISILTSPIEIIELLLKFSETLEQTNHEKYACDLRQRIKEKVLTFKTKLNLEYPLTAAFQEELLAANEKSCTAVTANIPKEQTKPDFENMCKENNFFQLEEDFYGLMSQAMDLSPSTIPSPFRNMLKADGAALTSSYMEEDICERQVTRIKQFFRDCQFDLLGKYLNELRPNVVERAAEEFLKLLFHMKISLQQSVDLIKIIMLPSKSENSAKVIASISVTLILNLVRINQWNKAFTILSLCQEKEINLLEGKVFYFNELNTITQCRIILLFVEIYAYKDDYASAVDLIKKNYLFSSDNSLWKLTWKDYDETIRVRILEDLLRKIISKQLTATAFNLFEMIWREQKQLLGPVDLRKFINEILILLLNQNNEEAITLYEKIKAQVQLNDTTVRAILVTFFRCNRLSAAKNLFLSPYQSAYFPPALISSSSVIRVLSFWLEEEIYVMFDSFFDYLVTNKEDFNLTMDCDFEIQIQLTKPNMDPTPTFRPLCLGIINPTFKDTCTRIQRVLQYQFNPPVKLIIMPYCLKLDEYSLKLHLQKRMGQNLV